MAKTVRTLTEYTDDLDGGEATETVSFALDGTSYEIDLNEGNAAALRDALARYTASGRRTGRGGGPRRSSNGGSGSGAGSASAPRRAAAGGDNRTAQIRAWAREQGLTVNERGRIPGSIVEQYDAAH